MGAARTAEDGQGDVRELTVESTGGARLHTEIHGRVDGPTVLLAHGWTCNTTFWEPVIRQLAGTHRVVLYDQRGHGRSPATPGSCDTEALADDLCAVLEATTEPGEKVVAGGHSMGAMTLVAAARRQVFRERVSAAMLCSTGMERLLHEARVAPIRSVKLRYRVQKLVFTAALPLGPVTPLGKRVLAHSTLGAGASAALRTQVAEMVHACPRKVRAEWAGVLSTLALADRLADLTVPTAVVHGDADRLTPPVLAHRMVQGLPALTELHMLPGLGHMTPLEDPAVVAQVLRELGPAGRAAAPEAAPETDQAPAQGTDPQPAQETA
ncbi:alpha/beta hydrolase [Streptomyces sp. ACA25]|uniref:alpha/beta fold hydrolase n=1 Tax=Streptomyces sp. ACA25 TaxID=3022596 RepID=UPI002307D3A6|nr:alpha/beta hydrolase [Streptomyces sp. ACA25]MDB1087280.1 alpha/beta hydrolase [Streptomyces sp. ACA25]